MDGPKYSADETLLRIIDQAMKALEELDEARNSGESPEFVNGSYNAWLECLQIAQQWENAEELGLDWDIEENFPPR